MAEVICSFRLSHQTCVQTLIPLFTFNSNIKHNTLCFNIPPTSYMCFDFLLTHPQSHILYKHTSSC